MMTFPKIYEGSVIQGLHDKYIWSHSDWILLQWNWAPEVERWGKSLEGSFGAWLPEKPSVFHKYYYIVFRSAISDVTTALRRAEHEI